MEDNWQLKPESLLKEGLYRIVRFLEQDDTGITYEAEQVPENQRVYVREFFLQGRCNRFFSTSKMSVIPGENSDEVNQLLARFLQEGRQKKGRGDLLDVFEDNWTAYYILKRFSGRVRPEPETVNNNTLTETDSVRRQPETKSLEVPIAEDTRLPQENKPERKKPEDLKGKRKHLPYGLMSVLSLGLLALVLFFLFRPDRTGGGKVDENTEWVVPDEVQRNPSEVEEQDKVLTEEEKQHYRDLVGSCWDSIGAWGDYKGTVPTDALALLKEIKRQEKVLGKYSEDFNESSGLADELLGKIDTAKQRWEKAGDDQKPISAERARNCYQLALDLAKSIVSLRKEVLEIETDDMQLQSDISRIRNKINGLK